MDRPTFRTLIIFLDENPGQFTYSEVARQLSTWTRAVGSMLRALARRGLHSYCRRIVSEETGEPLIEC
jgi:Mn-dependent DtxR family transcriptional regulator